MALSLSIGATTVTDFLHGRGSTARGNKQAHDTLDNLPNLNRRELSVPNDRCAQGI
jgi:hypothetical protein